MDRYSGHVTFTDDTVITIGPASYMTVADDLNALMHTTVKTVAEISVNQVTDYYSPQRQADAQETVQRFGQLSRNCRHGR